MWSASRVKTSVLHESSMACWIRHLELGVAKKPSHHMRPVSVLGTFFSSFWFLTNGLRRVPAKVCVSKTSHVLFSSNFISWGTILFPHSGVPTSHCFQAIFCWVGTGLNELLMRKKSTPSGGRVRLESLPDLPPLGFATVRTLEQWRFGVIPTPVV